MRLDGEETFFGENIDTPKEFVEDLCDRVNTVFSTVIEKIFLFFTVHSKEFKYFQ